MFNKLGLFAIPALLLFCAPSPAAGKSDFDRLKSLAGDWALMTPADEDSGLRATYLVLAGGSALLEILFAETPEETATIYHLDNRRITVTQLCGRYPPVRLEPRSRPDRDTLRFEREKQEAQEPGLKEIRLLFLDEEKLRIKWLLSPDGKAVENRSFTLERAAPIEELAAEVGRLRVSLESLQRELDRRLKRTINLKGKEKPEKIFLETRTLPPGPGWNVSGVPFRQLLHKQTTPFASTFASRGDKGMTVGHYGFRAGAGCRVRFSVLGGHGAIAVVEETRAPPRRIREIPEFSVELEGGTYGKVIERIQGERWAKHAIAVDWDLSRFEGKALRLYVVDAVSNHYGQIAISEISIVENKPAR